MRMDRNNQQIEMDDILRRISRSEPYHRPLPLNSHLANRANRVFNQRRPQIPILSHFKEMNFQILLINPNDKMDGRRHKVLPLFLLQCTLNSDPNRLQTLHVPNPCIKEQCLWVQHRVLCFGKDPHSNR